MTKKKMVLGFLGLFFLMLAVICFFIQGTFYGYIDDQGIIHDSIFLPFGYIFGLLGMVVLLIFVCSLFLDKKKN